MTLEHAADERRRPYRSPQPAGAGYDEVKLSVHDLDAWYGSTYVVKRVSMDIPANQITAVIGPSGCGKSTFVRCLNRMHECIPGARMEGRVELEGVNIYADEIDPVLVRRRVGMVFQKPNPFPMMSIRDNVLAGLTLTGQRPRGREADALVERALRGAALWDEVKDSLHKRGVSLSGGQQQRLCIARSLAVEPEVLLMDEPCSALDPIATTRIEDLMHSLRAHYTIVIVTHNLQQAARVSQKTAFFYTGDLIEFSDTDTIFTSPRDKRTEDYITGKFG